MTLRPDTPAADSDSPTEPKRGHPRGLYTLFFTEMWERFSFYGMRALLVLFMVDSIQDGGLGLTDEIATAIYGLYTAAVYLSALPGGWVADRFLGAQRSIWCGGIVIAAGHFVLAIPGTETFYLGLLLVVIGTGLLKPNISAVVGDLYPEGGARRDAGFTIFYMGINLGAALGPLVCSTLGEKLNWHYGFGAAGVGMVLGLIQFKLTRHHLGNAGAAEGKSPSWTERTVLITAAAALVVLVILTWTGVIRVNPLVIARGSTTFIVLVAVCYFAGLFAFANLDRTEKRRLGIIVILFVASALFWAGFEQAGSSFNLFADRHTDRMQFGFEIPAGWFQSLGPVFVIVLAPVMASLWIALARRQVDPSIPAKFGLGLLLLGMGFLVMAGAAVSLSANGQVSPSWLVMTYLLHTFGELCLSPVGLSSVTKLAPRRFVGQMMGLWFLATSLGNLLAGLIAGRFSSEAVEQMPGQYIQLALLAIAAAVVLIAAAPIIRRWSGGTH